MRKSETKYFEHGEVTFQITYKYGCVIVRHPDGLYCAIGRGRHTTGGYPYAIRPPKKGKFRSFLGRRRAIDSNFCLRSFPEALRGACDWILQDTRRAKRRSFAEIHESFEGLH